MESTREQAPDGIGGAYVVDADGVRRLVERTAPAQQRSGVKPPLTTEPQDPQPTPEA